MACLYTVYYGDPVLCYLTGGLTMPGKCRPSLRAKTLENVMRSNLSVTDKECIKAAFDLNDVLQRREAEPVRHGRWIISSDGYYPYCSECKERPKSGDMTKHCPNCGAKMDF